MTAERVRVVIADDQPVLRHGLKSLLEGSGRIEVVAEAGTGDEALTAAARTRPDVVLMDIRMPDLDGIEAARRLPQTKVVMLTTFDLDDYVIEALRAGASGFLLKTAPLPELVAAIEAVAAGDAFLDTRSTRRLLDQVARRLPVAVAAGAGDVLTPREQTVLRMVAGGQTNAEIATALHLSEATIKTHVSSMLGKLGLRDRVQAVIYAYENGIIEHPAPGPRR
jgi:DNA-binding NarL/FixJ family response regulator